MNTIKFNDMKKALVICTLVVAGTAVWAQSLPMYSLNFDNRFVHNPARTGFNGSPELYLIYRKQWVDFNGAPETRAASFDMAVKKGGFGFYLFNDITDVFTTWGGSFNYAYHLKFKNDMHRVSIGLSAGLQDFSFDRQAVSESGADLSDPLLQGDRGLAFDGGAGVHYMFAKDNLLNLSFGFSAQSLFATDLKFLNEGSQSTLIVPDRTYLAILSNRFRLLEEKLIVEPMVITRFPESFNYQIEPGVLVGYKDWAWLSFLYRYNHGLTMGAGFKVHDAVKVGYAYDLSLNDIKDYTNGSHEVMLGILFGKRKEDMASKQELEELKKQLLERDSLYRSMQDNQDSLLNVIDELNYRLEDMQYKMDSVAAMQISIDDSTLAEMMKTGGTEAMNKEMARLKKEMDDLRKMKDEMERTLKETKTRVKDLESEMTEERTRIVDEEDLRVVHGPPLGNYFMVVGSFRVKQNSENFYQDLKKRGYDAGVIYDEKRKWYYVHIAQPKDLKKGLQDLYKLREENPEFHDAWIHIMRKSIR